MPSSTVANQLDPSEATAHSAINSDSRQAAISGENNSRRHRSVDEYSQVMRSFKPSIHSLHAFAAKPLQTEFATQEAGEQLILLLRKHPITQVGWILIATIFAIIPTFIDPGSFFIFLPADYSVVINIAWYAGVIAFIFQEFLTWYFNVYLITDERVVDVDFNSLINRNITSAKIGNIEDVTATAGGVLQTIIDYGTVTVQTAGAKPEVEFEDVPHPNLIVELLNELLQEEEQEALEGRVN